MNPLIAAVLAFLIQNHVVAFTIYAKGTDSEEIQNLLPLVRGLGPALPTSNDVPDDKDAVALALEFGNFKARFNKKYASAEEEDYRYMTFKKNIAIARTIQSLEQGTAKYGVTKFSDLTGEEFASYYLTPTSYWVADPELPKAAIPDGDIPASVDWRTNGAVTEVKNQGQCGSCWAFSTTGNIEGQWFLKRGALISLSEQELVSCDKLDEGCSGGLPSNAYKAVMQLGGLETESKYPYTAKNSKCSFEASATAAYINSSVSISSNETEMAAWLAQNGPISIGINAAVMQFYFGGISHPWKIFCSPSNLDHGVLIVGYGTENSTPYWIVKNSWGEDWGEKGYYRVYRGDGTCGLNTMCTSAVVD